MELAFVYTKKRADFGHECEFSDVPARIMEAIPSRYGWLQPRQAGSLCVPRKEGRNVF
jgi:hypothetical protein